MTVLLYIYLFSHIEILFGSINLCLNNIFATFSGFTTLFLFKFDDIKILTRLIFHGIILPYHCCKHISRPYPTLPLYKLTYLFLSFSSLSCLDKNNSAVVAASSMLDIKIMLLFCFERFLLVNVLGLINVQYKTMLKGVWGQKM
jgi:hypothetical protein